MLVFSRHRSINCEKVSGQRLLIRGSSVDTYHEISLEIIVDMEARKLISVSGDIIRAPYTYCKHTSTLLNQLEGESISKGVTKKVLEKIGGPGGCNQFVDMVIELLRAVAECDEAFLSETDRRDSLKYWHNKLKGKCYAHSHSLAEKKKCLTIPILLSLP